MTARNTARMTDQGSPATPQELEIRDEHHPSCCGSCDDCLRICWGYHGPERRMAVRRNLDRMDSALREAEAREDAAAPGLREALLKVQAKADHFRGLAERTAISSEDWRFTNGYSMALRDLRDALAAAPAAAADARSPLDGVDRRMLEWVADQPVGFGDWACVECHPGSDILVDGFRCMVHEARRRLASLPATADTPEASR